MKKTRWFPPDTKPCYRGWYEVCDTGVLFRDYWNGHVWCRAPGAKPYRMQNFMWRGMVCKVETINPTP